MGTIRFKTSSPAGDLISMLAGIRQMCKDRNSTAIVMQRLDVVGVGHAGSIHPFKNENDEPVCMNRKMFDMLRPLLLHQDYIEDYVIYTGQLFDVDLDKARLEVYTGQPQGSLHRWIFHAYPQMACDLSQSWITAEPSPFLKAKYEESVIINFTQRYRNHFVDYFFLKQYKQNLIFAGLSEEHEEFCKQWNLSIPLLTVIDFLELAKIISSCKFVIGNQSFVFNLAEALKVPRILELFQLMPNVIPIGENSFDYYHNDECRYYFDKLHNLAK